MRFLARLLAQRTTFSRGELHSQKITRERGCRISNNRQWSNQSADVVDTTMLQLLDRKLDPLWATVVNREWPTTPSYTFHTDLLYKILLNKLSAKLADRIESDAGSIGTLLSMLIFFTA